MTYSMAKIFSLCFTEMSTSTATLIVTKLEEIPSCTMNMITSMYPYFKSSIWFTTINRRLPVSETAYIEAKTHLKFLTLPFELFIREAAILDSKMPPSKHPTK